MNKYFPALTGIRAVAALMVCLFHFNPFREDWVGSHVHNFFGEFHVGVTLFFVLSGFLICVRYYDKDKIQLKEYFINRIARIYPVYFLLTLTYFAFLFFKNILPLKEFFFQLFLNMTLLKGFFDDYKFSGLLPAWSLSVEESFYLIAPILFFFIKKSYWNLILLPLLGLLLGCCLVQGFKEVSFYGFFQNYEFMLSFSFLGRIFEFMIGIALGILVLKKEVHLLKYTKGMLFTLTGILMITIYIFWISTYKGTQIGIVQNEAKFINNFLMPLMGIVPLYIGLIYETTLLKKILSSPVFILLGKASYVFYLIHLEVGKWNDNFLFVCIIGFAISILLFYFIEEPLNKKVKTLMKR